VQVYKVYITDNKPVSAILLGDTGDNYADLLNADGSISWLPILAENEEESIAIACSIIADGI